MVEAEKKWPASEVEFRKVDALVPYARNARTHSPAQVDQIAASILEWGWTNPVLVDEGGMLIAGHGRILAATKLGIEDVPCMVARGWSESQKRAYVVADNRLALNSSWDEEMLRVEFGELADLGELNLELTGFTASEIDFFTTEPDFSSDSETNDRLDKKKTITCPECAHEWEPE